ncbi:hypothetical protein L208DRAFT_1160931, partial [Tricholoma matsutake]
LNCLIEGESIVFLVTVWHNCVVSNLKKKIKREQELGILKDIDPHTVELWKVSIDLKTHDKHSLSHLKVENLEGVKEFTPWRLIREYWLDQPVTMHLHIIVK